MFAPVQVLPWYLDILSKLSPLRYAVDLTRNIFYTGQADGPKVVLDAMPINIAVMAGMFWAFLVVGTVMFTRSERNR